MPSSRIVNSAFDANGFNTFDGDFIKSVRSLYPKLVIMAGNVCNASRFTYLNDLDVDCIRVGIGSGSICTTRLETGIGKGQWSAVNECFQYSNAINSDLNNNAKIIFDNFINIYSNKINKKKNNKLNKFLNIIENLLIDINNNIKLLEFDIDFFKY